MPLTEHEIEKNNMAVRYGRGSPPYAYKRLLNRIEGKYPDRIIPNDEWFTQLPSLEKEVSRIGFAREREWLQNSIQFHAQLREFHGHPVL